MENASKNVIVVVAIDPLVKLNVITIQIVKIIVLQ
jgi:hypothetical protein